MRKLDKVCARLSFSPKYPRVVAENVIKPLIFMYHEAMSIFLGSTNVLISVYFGLSIFFWGLKFPKFNTFLDFSKIYNVSDPRHMPIEVPPPGEKVKNGKAFQSSAIYFSPLLEK